MGKPLFYLIFHGNLAFSAIEEEQLGEVIDKCYFPFLALARDNNTKLGLELSAYSLEKIAELRPEWIEQCKELIGLGLVEIVGSGYMQCIGPIIPYEVNLKNQQIGLEVYQSILGVTPTIAYVNEQTFSKGLVDLYYEAGYQAIAMEWNNGAVSNPDWKPSNSFSPKQVAGESHKLPVLWTDSIAFQFFQRVIHGEKEPTDYLQDITQLINKGYQALPVYSSDIEIFNFRPGRFETEAKLNGDEWQEIQALLEKLKPLGNICLPAEVLANFDGGKPTVALTSAAQPIIVKKQRKYSLSRWAACGRGATFINNLCFRYYQHIANRDENTDEWKSLLKHWGSDYRTHITQLKWQKAMETLHRFNSPPPLPAQLATADIAPSYNSVLEGKQLLISNDEYQLTFNLLKGLTLDSIYRDGTPLGVGTVKHGELDDIGFGADFYTGTSTIESVETGKVADLNTVEQYSLEPTAHGCTLACTLTLKNGATLYKVWSIDFDKKRLTFDAHLALKEPVRGAIRLGALTLQSSHCDDPIWYECHNGGKHIERYTLAKEDIVEHHLPNSLIQSSRNGLGVSEGVLRFGKLDTTICEVQIDQAVSYPFIMLQHSVGGEHKLTRVFFSLQELDDTLKAPTQTNFRLSYSISL